MLDCSRWSGESQWVDETKIRMGSIPGGATFPFKPMLFKGLRTVRPRLCLGLDTISIGLRTMEESRPSDSSTTAVITLRFLTTSKYACTLTVICSPRL